MHKGTGPAWWLEEFGNKSFKMLKEILGDKQHTPVCSSHSDEEIFKMYKKTEVRVFRWGEKNGIQIHNNDEVNRYQK